MNKFQAAKLDLECDADGLDRGLIANPGPFECLELAAAIGAHAVGERESLAHLGALLATPLKRGAGAADIGFRTFNRLPAFRAKRRSGRSRLDDGLAGNERLGVLACHGPLDLSSLQPRRYAFCGTAAGAHRENNRRAARYDVAAGKNATHIG